VEVEQDLKEVSIEENLDVWATFQHLCPPFYTILINTYHEDINLYIGGSILHSVEGTT